MIQDYVDYTSLEEHLFYYKLDEDFKKKCGVDEESDIDFENTDLENYHNLITPSAYERQSTSHRLAGNLKAPPREDYGKSEVQSRDMEQPPDVPLIEKYAM